MSNILATFAQSMYTYDGYTSSSSSELNGPVIAIMVLLTLVFLAITVIGLWKVFQKAGRPGWAAIVPFYNYWVLAEISGRPGWFGLLAVLVSFVPFVGWIGSLVMTLMLALGLAQKFNKSTAFAVVGLWLFSFVGYLMLGFGHDTYDASKGPQGTFGDSGPSNPSNPTATAPVTSVAPVSPTPPTNPTPPTPPTTPYPPTTPTTPVV